jgi:hypothetical protein
MSEKPTEGKIVFERKANYSFPFSSADSHEYVTELQNVKRMIQLSEKAMEKENFTVEDVRKDLKKLRETYPDREEQSK